MIELININGHMLYLNARNIVAVFDGDRAGEVDILTVGGVLYSVHADLGHVLDKIEKAL